MDLSKVGSCATSRLILLASFGNAKNSVDVAISEQVEHVSCLIIFGGYGIL